MYGIQLFCVLSNSHPVLWVKRRRLEKDICASDSAAGGSLRPIKHPPAADPGPQALQSLLGATATPPSSDGAVNESLGKPNLSRESRSCRHLHHIKKTWYCHTHVQNHTMMHVQKTWFYNVTSSEAWSTMMHAHQNIVISFDNTMLFYIAIIVIPCF